MGNSEFISGLSLVVSLASFAASGITIYLNFFRKPKYVSPPIRWIAFGLWHNGNNENTLLINIPIVATNIGGNTGVIDSFYIDLISLSTQEKERFYA